MRFLIEEANEHSIGVYCIENTITGKKYIGSTTQSFKRRWSSYTKYGGYCNAKLLNALNKYGWENFTFSVVEIVPKEGVREREEFFIEKFDVIANGYNVKPYGTGGNGGANVGKKYPKPSKEVVAQRAKGISKALKGKPKSKAHCEAISKAKMGCKPSHSHDVVLWDTKEECVVEYNSATDAAKKIGCSIQQVCSLVKGQSKLLKRRFTLYYPHQTSELPLAPQ